MYTNSEIIVRVSESESRIEANDILEGIDLGPALPNMQPCRLGVWPEGVFADVAGFWHSLGYNVIPGTIDKRPMVRFEYWSGTDGHYIPDEVLTDWAMFYPDATPLIITGFHRDGANGAPINVIDADSPTVSPWIEEQFGKTPMTVQTGREGGGCHHWYRDSNGLGVSGRNKIIGPDDEINWAYRIHDDGMVEKSSDWGKTKIDVKSRRNYVVAPGATHKSGRIYTPSVPVESISIEWLKTNLPVFDENKYNALVKESAERKAARDKAIREEAAKIKPPLEFNGSNVSETLSVMEEPFIKWCESEPQSVQFQTWWGLATNIAAVHGESGRVEFHRISALDPQRYNKDECDKNYTRALSSLTNFGPMTYAKLIEEGWPGPAPQGFKAPAVMLRAISKSAGQDRSAPKWPVTMLNKSGNSVPVPHAIENTKAMLEFHKIDLRYNLMTHDVEISTPEGVLFVAETRASAGISFIRDLARRHGLQISALEDHMTIILAERGYHPVVKWIESKPWDGTDRITALLSSLTVAPGYDVALANKLFTTWMVTAAVAFFVPGEAREGVASQGVLVLQGGQDIQKTRWLGSLLPADRAWFKDGVLLDPSSRDSVQKATRYAICELGELDATFRRADIARLKSFITERVDTYRSSYARREEEYPRRTVFVGSVNPSTFLVDSTGNRRFWVVPVVHCNPAHGVDLQQLWAQASCMARSGHPTWLDEETKSKLAVSNKAFEGLDPLEIAFDERFEIDAAGRMPQSAIVAAIKPLVGSWGQKDSRHLMAIIRERVRAEGLDSTRSNGVSFWPVKMRLIDGLEGVLDIF